MKYASISRSSVHAEVILVTGPPCAGKTTYVDEHREPGDLVVDYDAIAVALGSPDSHDHPPTLWPYVLQARDAVTDRMSRDPNLRRAWLIRCDPTDQDRAIASDIVTLATDAETCKRRAEDAGRPARWVALIDDWHTRHSA